MAVLIIAIIAIVIGLLMFNFGSGPQSTSFGGLITIFGFVIALFSVLGKQ